MKAFAKAEEWTSIKVLGVGGFGVVFLNKNVTSNELVAQKIVPLGPVGIGYKSEVVIHFQLKHPNVLNL